MPSTLLSGTGDPQKQVNCLVRGTYNLAEKKGKIRVQRTQPRPTLIPGRGEVASGKLAWKGTSAGLHHDKRGFPPGTGDGSSGFQVEELERPRLWPWACVGYASGQGSKTWLKRRLGQGVYSGSGH